MHLSHFGQYIPNAPFSYGLTHIHNWSFPFALKCATNTCVLSAVLVEENFLDLTILNKNGDTLPVISMSIVGWPCDARLLAAVPKVVSVDSVATTCVNSYKDWCSLIEGGVTGAIIAAAWKIRVAETTRSSIKFINGTIAICITQVLAVDSSQ